MAGETCFDDFNCSGTLICYQNVPWAPEDFPDTFCGCSGWYGWTGDDCLSYGPGTYLMVVIEALCGTLMFYFLVKLIKALRLQLRGKHFPVALQSSTYLAIAMVIAFEVNISIRTMKALTPSQHVSQTVENGFERKDHNLSNPEIITVGVVFSLGVLLALNFPLVWYEACYILLKPNDAILTNKIRSLEILTILGDIIYICTSSAIDIREFTGLFTLFALASIILACWIHWAMYFRLKAVMVEMQLENHKAFVQVFARIRKSIFVVIIGFVLVVVLGLVYGLLVFIPKEGWRTISQTASVSPASIANQGIFIGVLIAAYGYTIYICSAVNDLYSTKQISMAI